MITGGNAVNFDSRKLSHGSQLLKIWPEYIEGNVLASYTLRKYELETTKHIFHSNAVYYRF